MQYPAELLSHPMGGGEVVPAPLVGSATDVPWFWDQGANSFREFSRWLLQDSKSILRHVLSQPAIHVIGAAGDVFGFAACQEKRKRGDFFRFAEARQRNRLNRFFQLHWVVENFLIDRRGDGSRSNVVYVDFMLRQFQGEIAHQHPFTAFRGAVRRVLRKGNVLVNRRNKNHFAALALFHHLPRRGLAHEETAVKIYRKNPVPLVIGDV